MKNYNPKKSKTKRTTKNKEPNKKLEIE